MTILFHLIINNAWFVMSNIAITVLLVMLILAIFVKMDMKGQIVSLIVLIIALKGALCLRYVISVI